MSFVVLGLLLIRPMSLYDLIKGFEAGVSLFYSASSGSIKRALDGLLAAGHIAVADTGRQARGRKVYEITDTGRQHFHAWLTGDLTGSDLETAVLSRLFFLGHVAPAERLVVLHTIIARTADSLAELESRRDEIAALPVPDEWRALAFHQRAVLDYGIASHRHSLDWLREHLAETERDETERAETERGK
ncbi:PadR family transcriptional regulator [Microlunatus sp. Y2014]|uniref:PadR family transcriptional regulator n=1 Tax=Microlunatus sp. Y2014 TaxID=3418488 RepID=UPI003DA793D4